MSRSDKKTEQKQLKFGDDSEPKYPLRDDLKDTDVETFLNREVEDDEILENLYEDLDAKLAEEKFVDDRIKLKDQLKAKLSESNFIEEKQVEFGDDSEPKYPLRDDLKDTDVETFLNREVEDDEILPDLYEKLDKAKEQERKDDLKIIRDDHEIRFYKSEMENLLNAILEKDEKMAVSIVKRSCEIFGLLSDLMQQEISCNPLVRAIQSQLWPVVDALIENRLFINYQDDSCDFPLISAVKMQDEDTFDKLTYLQNDKNFVVDFGVQDLYGNTALMVIVNKYNENKENEDKKKFLHMFDSAIETQNLTLPEAIFIENLQSNSPVQSVLQSNNIDIALRLLIIAVRGDEFSFVGNLFSMIKQYDRVFRNPFNIGVAEYLAENILKTNNIATRYSLVYEYALDLQGYCLEQRELEKDNNQAEFKEGEEKKEGNSTEQKTKAVVMKDQNLQEGENDEIEIVSIDEEEGEIESTDEEENSTPSTSVKEAQGKNLRGTNLENTK